MNNYNNDPIAIEPQSHYSKNPQSFQTQTSATLPSSLSNQDFHFFNNFENFTLPTDRIAKRSDSWNNAINLANDWVADLNDEILEQFNISMDEKEHQTGHVIGSVQDNYGFQLVQGKKTKKGASEAVVTTTKAKVPFHIPTIRKPQEKYNILVDNSNQPFEHVWLQRSDDGLRFVHPLEKLSVMNFVDKDIAYSEPIMPSSIESTQSKLVEEVKDLKELAAKLRGVDEFAVDLEHNQYRSFQGLTCLMQISTRTEDFIVDTLKLRIHIGPYLREVFKDPKKKKVMHGADRDILWLQRDFGIYLCNLFDTGQGQFACDPKSG